MIINIVYGFFYRYIVLILIDNFLLDFFVMVEEIFGFMLFIIIVRILNLGVCKVNFFYVFLFDFGLFF